MKVIRIACGDQPIDLGGCARAERLLRALPAPPDVVGVPVEGSRDPALLVERLGWALSQGRADAANCAAACLAVGLPHGVQIGAVFAACDPRYQCVALERPRLEDLPSGSRVVTWDAVSRAQILHRFRGLKVEVAASWADLFEGLRHEVWAAGCLPPEVVDAAPHWRLKVEPIPAEAVMPAIGQGVQALLCLEGGGAPILSQLNQPETECRLQVESAFWWEAMEECGTVATAAACCSADQAEIRGLIADADGTWLVTDSTRAPLQSAEDGAQQLADRCKTLCRREPRREGVGKAG